MIKQCYVQIIFTTTTKNDRRRHLYSQANLQRALEITIGAGTVIKGFDEAVSNMKVGDKGRFVLPPHIGYGDAGQPGFQIPSGATLIYYLELIGHTPKNTFTVDMVVHVIDLIHVCSACVWCKFFNTAVQNRTLFYYEVLRTKIYYI